MCTGVGPPCEAEDVELERHTSRSPCWCGSTRLVSVKVLDLLDPHGVGRAQHHHPKCPIMVVIGHLPLYIERLARSPRASRPRPRCPWAGPWSTTTDTHVPIALRDQDDNEVATGNTSVATVARVQAWQGDKKKPDEIQKLELTLERTLRHQRAQARATRTESAVVTAVEVERRFRVPPANARRPGPCGRGQGAASRALARVSGTRGGEREKGAAQGRCGGARGCREAAPRGSQVPAPSLRGRRGVVAEAASWL